MTEFDRHKYTNITIISLPKLSLGKIKRIYSVGANDRNDFHELRQQAPATDSGLWFQASPDNFREAHKHQSQPRHIQEIHKSKQKHPRLTSSHETPFR